MALSFEDQAQVRDIIREELQRFSDRQVFNKHIQMQEGRDIEVGTEDGTQIGRSASEKIAFHGVTPVTQQNDPGNPSPTQVTDQGDQTDNFAINDAIATLQDSNEAILDVLRAYGFI